MPLDSRKKRKNVKLCISGKQLTKGLLKILGLIKCTLILQASKVRFFLLVFNFSFWLFHCYDTFFLLFFQYATKYRSQNLTNLTMLIAYLTHASRKTIVRNGFWKMKNLVMCITKTFGLPKRELTINLSSLIWVAIAISGKLKSSTTLIHLGIS